MAVPLLNSVFWHLADSTHFVLCALDRPGRPVAGPTVPLLENHRCRRPVAGRAVALWLGRPGRAREMVLALNRFFTEANHERVCEELDQLRPSLTVPIWVIGLK